MTTRRQFLTTSVAAAVIPINAVANTDTDPFLEIRNGKELRATKILGRDLDVPDIELRVYQISKWDRHKILNRGNYEVYSLTDGIVRRCKLVGDGDAAMYALEEEIPGRQIPIYPSEFGLYVRKPAKWT